MNELDELLGHLGNALDDGLDEATPRAADQARALLTGAIHVESPNTVGRRRRGSARGEAWAAGRAYSSSA